MDEFEFFLIYIIHSAALNAGPYINEVTDEKFYEAEHMLNDYIVEYLSYR